MPSKKKKSIELPDNRYEEFLKRLRPVVIGLVRCSSNLDRAFLLDLYERKQRPRFDVSAKYRLEKVEEKHFDAVAEFTLEISNEARKAKALTVECVYQTHFHSRSPIDKALAQKFTDSEFRVVVWPFFRQFVSDMTSRMSIPPVIIPLSTESSPSE